MGAAGRQRPGAGKGRTYSLVVSVIGGQQHPDLDRECIEVGGLGDDTIV
jgi:hypothetical protein